VNGHSDADDEDDGEDNEAEIDDEDEEDQPRAKPRRISERKRRQNAIADSYLQDALQDPARKHKVLPEEEDKQSTRWIVHQAESRQIISSPREYQIELFERAKERNIIAVLDTGMFAILKVSLIVNHSHVTGSGKTLIAVLLLRHIFAQELEDRALGKTKRISFFLVSLRCLSSCQC
jgi:endoribonuclease Dicer